MREQMKKLKSGPSTSEYSSFHGKYIIDVVCHTVPTTLPFYTVQRYCHVVPLVGLTLHLTIRLECEFQTLRVVSCLIFSKVTPGESYDQTTIHKVTVLLRS